MSFCQYFKSSLIAFWFFTFIKWNFFSFFCKIVLFLCKIVSFLLQNILFFLLSSLGYLLGGHFSVFLLARFLIVSQYDKIIVFPLALAAYKIGATLDVCIWFINISIVSLVEIWLK